eukprot:1137333-Pelagomonas_calceolata.AAC.16
MFIQFWPVLKAASPTECNNYGQRKDCMTALPQGHVQGLQFFREILGYPYGLQGAGSRTVSGCSRGGQQDAKGSIYRVPVRIVKQSGRTLLALQTVAPII